MTTLHRLAELGQSPWLDFISRSSIRGGEMKKLMDQGILGVTSNPAIFEKAIAGSTDYDAEIRELGKKGLSAEQIYDKLSIGDVGEAADLFRPIYDKTDGLDGYVSLEVSPHLAHNTSGTIQEGIRLFNTLNRPNVMIKVPATEEGIPAIEELIAEGIPVNVTLLFSLDRYKQAAKAYIAGLRRRMNQGKPLKVESVASFFVSRMDSLLDPQVGEEWRGRAAIENSRAAYGLFIDLFEGDDFADLEAAGARPQRVLWASTSTKDPAYSPVMYVEALIGDKTVNTLPMNTIEAYLEQGEPQERLRETVSEAREQMARLEGEGVDFDKAGLQLEREGIEKFVQPFDDLIAAIEKKKSEVLSEA